MTLDANRIAISSCCIITWLAGYVDAVGFLSLSHIYTANMSGNSVAVGIQLASRIASHRYSVSSRADRD
ncbi:MAG: DUF1275 family protein [Acidobacteriaceae bacterium]|nr:DUF1275 family protein [Acidobacteriaceae bacterium]